MSRIVTLSMASVVLLSLVLSAEAAPRRAAKAPEAAQPGVTVKTIRKGEYANVAGFKGRVNDPLYSYASEPLPAKPKTPVITSFPMPYTVWW